MLSLFFSRCQEDWGGGGVFLVIGGNLASRTCPIILLIGRGIRDGDVFQLSTYVNVTFLMLHCWRKKEA